MAIANVYYLRNKKTPREMMIIATVSGKYFLSIFFIISLSVSIQVIIFPFYNLSELCPQQSLAVPAQY